MKRQRNLLPGSIVLAAAALVVVACGTPRGLTLKIATTEPCTADSTTACAWSIAYQYEADFQLSENQRALSIMPTGGVGYLTHDIAVPTEKGIRVATLSARLTLDSLIGRGAGLTLSAHTATGERLQIADQAWNDDGYLSGTQLGVERSLRIALPAEATRLTLGVIAYGTGSAIFSNIRLSITPTATASPSAETVAYARALIDTLGRHSLHRDSVNLSRLENDFLRLAASGDNRYLAVRYVLRSLRDGHSGFQTPAQRAAWSGESSDGKPPSGPWPGAEVKGGIGYLSVPGFHGDDSPRKERFADSIRQHLAMIARSGVKGIIVDLRPNDGGNMGPMLAGLEPLFRGDTLGALQDVRGGREYWGRSNRFAATTADYIESSVPVAIDNSLPLAILYDQRTGSSGEIVILSFTGNPNTRSFGRPSWGLTTGNGEFRMPDGAYLFLASTRMVDRNGVVYYGPIVPDVRVDKIEGEDADRAAATAWINSW